jgi:iron complex transport system permease protein
MTVLEQARPTPMPRTGRVLRIGQGVSLRVRPRPVATGALLLLLTLVLLVVAVGTGDFPIAPADVLAGLAGGGDGGTRFIVRELRLPRALCAVLVGIGLGVSGAVFQTITRNPLGSPDIVGFQQGAAAGALLVITVLAGSGAAGAAGALAGGALTALLVYLLAFQRGGTSGYRIVLIGIAMSALMLACTDFLLSRARIEDAQEATRWMLGSLNNRTWEDLVPLLVVIGGLLPAMVAAGPALRALELGDESAHGLGLRVERARFLLIALAVVLVSITTVAVGPVAFVALTAPQIARRLARTAAPTLTCSALVGAALVLAADIAAQRLVPGTPLPVGVMTGAFGGLYLAWLLTTEWRSGRA